MEDLTQFSGEEHYRRPQRLDFDEIRIRGDKGDFVRIKKVKDEWVSTELGKNVELILLRKRRKLVDFKNKMGTSEHNTPNDSVYLFGPNERGIAADLRKKYQTLRTNEIFYAIFGDEVVKLTIRGASLGSESKPENSVPLYDYLQSFPEEEHVYEYKTILSAVEEKSKLGRYYAISFAKGAKLTDSEFAKMAASMKEIARAIKSQDEYYKTKEVDKPTVEDLPRDTDPPLEVDEHETKPEDLPY